MSVRPHTEHDAITVEQVAAVAAPLLARSPAGWVAAVVQGVDTPLVVSDRCYHNYIAARQSCGRLIRQQGLDPHRPRWTARMTTLGGIEVANESATVVVEPEGGWEA